MFLSAITTNSLTAASTHAANPNPYLYQLPEQTTATDKYYY
jgi:hypothetical protein